MLIGRKSEQSNQNGGVTVCWFCFNAGPGRERKAIRASRRHSKIFVTILSRMNRSASGFPAVFRVKRAKQGISTFPLSEGSEGQKSSLTSRCNIKGKISSGIEKLLWLDKGYYFIDKILLKLTSLSKLLVLQTSGQNKDNQSPPFLLLVYGFPLF